jgi:arginine-tRNA-protein transferase
LTNKINDNNETFSTELVKANFTTEKFLLYKKYQIAVHNQPEIELNEESFTRFLVTSPLIYEKNLNFSDKNSNFKENFKEYFKEYFKDSNESNDDIEYGSYHQHYKINNKIIAVGVLDLLPSGVSSVYFFYDPDLKFLSLGKYSALTEINFCKTFNFEFYYMGFYIHDCDKMKYKGFLSFFYN